MRQVLKVTRRSQPADHSSIMKKPSLRTRFGYSMGNVLNDMCASLWFCYLLLFFVAVLGFTDSQAGALMLLGQVTDALATPLIGIASDRSSPLCRYGRRKSWHLAGTVLVAVSFPFVFHQPCSWLQTHEQQFIYFCAFIIVFQCGWAASFSSHVTLITELTTDSAQRAALNAYRHSTTVASGIIIYGVTWLVLGIDGRMNQVDSDDAPLFTILALGVVAVGCALAVVFHVLVKESPVILPLSILPVYPSSTAVVARPEDLTWRDWFYRFEFYHVALVYTSSRLYSNLFQMYTPLYLQHTLALPKYNVAAIPLVTYVSGFLSAFAVRVLVAHNKNLALLVGSLLGAISCLWVEFGWGEEYTRWQIYVVAAFFGLGGTTLQITSLSVAADMIGQNKLSGGFVFGAISFVEKLASGIAVVVAQELSPPARVHGVSSPYFRTVLSYGCGLAVSVTILCLIGFSLRGPSRFCRNAADTTGGQTNQKNVT